MNGWFAVKRGITDHPLFAKRPDRLAIWLWLLDHAVWKDTPHDIKGHTVMVPRGSVAASERRIADEVGVGYQVVRTFFDRLKSEHMINAQVTHGRSIITLCNFEKYQSANDAANASPNATLTQHQRTKEQGNNSSVTYVTGKAVDPTTAAFRAGIQILGESGVAEKNARALVGKWRKAHGDEAVIAALGRAQQSAAVDPVAFVEGIFRQRRTEQAGLSCFAPKREF